MASAIRQVFEYVTTTRGNADDVRDDIENINRGTDEMGDQAEKSSGQVGRLEGTLGGLKGALGAVAKILPAVTIGGIITGSAASAVHDVMAMDSAMNQFQAQTGITDESLEGFKDTAENLFAGGWGEGIDDVVSAMSTVQRVTGAEGDALEKTTQRALVFSQAFDRDVTESIRAADNMANVFGNSADANFNILAAAMQRTGDPAGDLLDTFNEYGSTFEQLGFGPIDMLNMLSSGMEAGAFNSDVLADSIREFGIRLKDGTSQEALWTLGLGEMNSEFRQGKVSGEDMFKAVRAGLMGIEDPMERNRLGVQLFGSKWEDMGEDIVLAMDPAAGSLADVQGAMDKAQTALSRGLGPAWTRFTRTIRMGLVNGLGPYIEQGLDIAVQAMEVIGVWLNNTGIPRFVEFTGVIAGGVGDVIEFADGLRNQLGGSGPILEDAASAIQSIANGAGDLVDFITRLSPGEIMTIGAALLYMAAPAVLSGIMGIGGAVAGMIGSLGGAAAAAWPLALAIGVIAAYESNFGGLRDKVNDIAQDLKEGDVDGAFQNIAEALLSIPTGIAEELASGLFGIDSTEFQARLDVWNQMPETLGNLFDGIQKFTGAKWDEFSANVDEGLVQPAKQAADDVWQAILGGVKSVRGTISYVPVAVKGWLGDIKDKISDGLVKPVKDAALDVWSAVLGEVGSVKSIISMVPGKIGEWLAGLDVSTALTGPFLTAINDIWFKLTGDDEGTLKTYLLGLPEQIAEWLTGLSEVGTALGTTLSAALTESVRTGLNDMISLIESAVNKVIDTINDMINLGGVVEKGLGLLGVEKPEVGHIEMPRLETGGILRGIGITGEEGAELAFASQPTAILSHRKSVTALQDAFGLAMPAGAAAGGAIYNFNGPVNLPNVRDPRQFLPEVEKEARRKNRRVAESNYRSDRWS